MNPYIFIDMYGIDKAERVVANVINDAKYYSNDTGSYYSSQQDNAVSIRKLKVAIYDYEQLQLSMKKYKAQVVDWAKKANK